ncbi:MAG: hypothetical protein LBD41_00865, partial [Clostridiales Family XIII bacterium]|nr:hypothetical protein [Clostridiales Family XIII bacterium]
MNSQVKTAINSSSKYNSRIQNNSFDVGIFRVGDYTWGNNFLILRDNTKAAFAKLDFLPIP